ncbi:MAG TPA: acyl-CoA thioester hydrolase/BAAT C-terminal domain-containing protein [Vicinamibacterales bacterium]
MIDHPGFAALALAVVTTGGIGLPPGTTVFATQPGYQETGRMERYDDLLVRVEQQVTGFGGMFIDRDGRLAVYLLDKSQLGAAEVAIAAVFGVDAVPAAGARALQGQYVVSELKAWSAMAADLLAVPGVTAVDLDEASNRVAIGVEHKSRAQAVERALSALAIPRHAVIIQVTENIRPVPPRVPYPQAQTSVKHEIAGAGFVANLYLPACQSKCPVVLLVGGSGGGIDWQDYMGEILSRNGFAAIAVAYFAMERLPKELDQIPLEYFQNVVAYARSHRSLNPDRIGIAGNSKGAELALLLATREPAIRAVVAFAPSSVVWQSLPSSAAWDRSADQLPRRSSWTFERQPFAFLPYAAAASGESLADMYRRSLNQQELVERAAIPVEHINGPVLLLSGTQDTTWPSSLMGDMVVKRLRERAFRFPNEHVAYDDAGHMIAWKRTDIPATRRGGTEQGNRVAQDDAERRMLQFFRQHLASTTGRN